MRSPEAGSITSPNTARPAASSCFSRNIGPAIARASEPARRTTPMPPRPGGVAMATMVSSRFMQELQNVKPKNASGYDYCAPAGQNGLQSAHRYDQLCDEDGPLPSPPSDSLHNPDQISNRSEEHTSEL